MSEINAKQRDADNKRLDDLLADHDASRPDPFSKMFCERSADHFHDRLVKSLATAPEAVRQFLTESLHDVASDQMASAEGMKPLIEQYVTKRRAACASK